jgi:hypothetical protein
MFPNGWEMDVQRYRHSFDEFWFSPFGVGGTQRAADIPGWTTLVMPGPIWAHCAGYIEWANEENVVNRWIRCRYCE